MTLARRLIRTLGKLTTKKRAIETPPVLNVFQKLAGVEQLYFDSVRELTYNGSESLGSDSGISFMYCLRDSWNDAGAFARFTLHDLSGEKAIVLSHVSYTFHKKEGLFRFIEIGKEGATIPLNHKDPLPELLRITSAIRTFIETIITGVEKP